MQMCGPQFPLLFRPCRVLGEPLYEHELDSQLCEKGSSLLLFRDRTVFKSGRQHTRVGVLRSIPREGLFSFQKVIADFRQTPATCFGSFSLRKRPGPYGAETWGFQKVIQQRLEDRIRLSLTLPLPYMGVFWASHVSSLGTSMSLLNRGECSMCTEKACAGDLIIYLFTI